MSETMKTPEKQGLKRTTSRQKISIRFFGDAEVRAVWDDAHSKWCFSILDIVGVLRGERDYEKNRNYWKYLKAKLKRENNQLGSVTTQFKFTAPDGKKRAANVLDYNGIVELAKNFPSKMANRFMEWLTYSDETIDGKSKSKAYALFDSTLLDTLEVGTVRGLQQIHGYLFGGLYDFAGQIRSKNIAKGGFQFAMARYLPQTLKDIEGMPENTFDEIADKYVEMNIAHPFMEGNGRSTRVWLDLILKKRLKRCVDWSKINKKDYLNAMEKSVSNPSQIKALLQNAITDKINDREVFMKGVDYSYYYEQEDGVTNDVEVRAGWDDEHSSKNGFAKPTRPTKATRPPRPTSNSASCPSGPRSPNPEPARTRPTKATKPPTPTSNSASSLSRPSGLTPQPEGLQP